MARRDQEKTKAYNRERMKDPVLRAKAVQASKEWRARQPKAVHAARKKKYLDENPNARLASYLRTRVREVVLNNLGIRAGSAVRDLGCTVAELKLYLEARFAPGMSWGNYGAWHLDHIKSLASFDLTDREQFLRACHYTNLQPLWAIDNIKKGAR